MKSNDQVSQWHRICNMRTTLLQLQYLVSSISSQLSLQSTTIAHTHKDRLLQLSSLHQQTHQLQSSNFKTLLIAKLESLLSVYMPIDDKIWSQLDSFVRSVGYVEEEMARDVCKLYIGAGMMVDIGRCQQQLKGIQDRIGVWLGEHCGELEEYNRGIGQIRAIQESWDGFLKEMQTNVKERIQPYYVDYIRKRVKAKQKQLAQSIKILQQFIKS